MKYAKRKFEEMVREALDGLPVHVQKRLEVAHYFGFEDEELEKSVDYRH